MSNGISIFAGSGIMLLVIIALYFIPSIIAIIKRKRNTVAILCLNILLGWTFIGWIVSLVWSLTNDVQPQVQQIIIRNDSTPENISNV